MTTEAQQAATAASAREVTAEPTLAGVPTQRDGDGRPGAAPDRTLHMVGNAHLDLAWLWPWQEGYAEARATFWSAIHRMDEYPDFVFTCDQVALLAWVEEQDPELFARIRERVADGRWVLTGGWWVEPDCNLPVGESFVRQGLYGQRYLQDRFGVTATVGMNVDPFGHHVMLPAILRGQGMDAYCFLRPGPHESALDATAFWWEAPDGSRVLAYRIPHEYCSPAGGVDGQVDKSLGQLDRTLGDLMVFYGVGNHGGGPTKANIDSIHRFDARGTYGRLEMSSPRRYLDHLASTRPAVVAALPVWRDELQHHAPGCYSAHSGVKAWMRRAQSAVLTAERWAAVGALRLGLPAPREDLARAWQQILLNQFHDVLPGSAIEHAYDDARDQLGEAVAVAKRITTRVHNVIARQVDVPFEESTQPVLVFNPHPWAVRADVDVHYAGQPDGVHVVDADGRRVPAQRTRSAATMSDRGRGAVAFQAVLPAFGYRLYRLRPLGGPRGATPDGRATLSAGPVPAWSERAPGALVATDTVLENGVLRAELDPTTGWLRSLLDKRTGRDVVAGARGEHLLVSRDDSDTWGHRVVSYARGGEPMRVVRTRLVEAGPLRAVLRVERAWGASTVVEEIVLGHDADHLEVRVTLDWREPAHLLKLRVPTALAEPRATFEVPFGTIERPVDGAEQPGQSWVDLTGTVDGPDGPAPAGLVVVNDAKHGYDASPAAADATASLGITAVRSPVYAWHDPRELDPDGAYTYQDQGVQRFRYQLVPHDGDWRAVAPTRRAALLGAPVRAMLETFHDGPLPASTSFADDGGGAVLVTALKPAEDGPADGADLVVRAVESSGRAAHARVDLPVVGRVLVADLGPHQIRTFRVPRDPALPVVEVDLVERPLDGSTP